MSGESEALHCEVEHWDRIGGCFGGELRLILLFSSVLTLEWLKCYHTLLFFGAIIIEDFNFLPPVVLSAAVTV
ncbi:hypothetical protein M758_3G013800 [Ceratodon purpureus]|uniref:Uncharacterized protein n=1 Tax=Ceratodon purpureus TaxID=3225 RepID=A0A8T0IG93_CERPU|nr:hypothetical protein KC19_3G013700 [Ceratodon purpureus]KAG0621361.1 hypothetical protein M758_3G013800 [Ceratodon purpureus]